MKTSEKCYLIGIKNLHGTNESDTQRDLRVRRGVEDLVKAGNRKFVCVLNEEGVCLAHKVGEMKTEYPDVSYDIIIPYETVASDWDEELRDAFFDAAEHCEKESFFEYHYSDGVFERLVGRIVGGSDHVVTVLF